MKWSKVKVLAEDFLCESLKGRVQYQVVVHRKSHDQTSSLRITLDGKEIFRASDIPYEMAVNRRGRELQWEREIEFPWEIPWPEIEDSEDYKAYHRAHADGVAEVESQEVFHSSEVKSLLFDYIHMPFEEAVSHAHPFVRAVSLFDRRFGKRRLVAMDGKQETGLFKTFYRIRMQADLQA